MTATHSRQSTQTSALGPIEPSSWRHSAGGRRGWLHVARQRNIGAIGQGLGYALAGVTVFMTFRVLGFVDLTVDGAFPIGGAACAILIVNGHSPEYAMLMGFVAGALTGLATALIDIIFKIEGLLASIIVITAAYTVTLHVGMARAISGRAGRRR